MANVLIIEKDHRIERAIYNYIKELDETHRIRSFKSAEPFETLYFHAQKKETSAESEEQESELQLLSTIHMIIFSEDCINENVLQWVKRIKEKTKEFEMWPESGAPLFVYTKYEEGENEGDRTKLIHPLLFDVVYLPLDRLLFLQKMEIALNLPNKTTPHYLFNEQVEMDIEISKRTLIEQISDVGMAIRNPIPLKPGLLGHFYFQIPGEAKTRQVYAKVFESSKHPDEPQQYLTYFLFFGIDKDTLFAIRKFLASKPRYRALKSEDPEDFAFNPDNLFLTDDDKRRKNIVVLESQDQARKSICEMISSEMDQVKIISESSYYMFLRRFMETKKEVEFSSATPAENSDFFVPEVTWLAASGSRKLIRTEAKARAGDQILGHSVAELFAKPEDWMEIFNTEEASKMFEEMWTLAIIQDEASNVLTIQHADGTFKKVQMDLEHNSTSGAIQITLRPPDKEILKEKDTLMESIDALVINFALIPQDVDAWLNSLRTNAIKRGLIPADRQLKVIVVGGDSNQFDPERYRSSGIFALTLSPIEPRTLLTYISIGANVPFTKYNPNNINWYDTQRPVFMAKSAHLEELSEFGASIRHPRPLSPGTTLFFHGAIFDKTPDDIVGGRLVASEEHPVHKGEYLCSFIYVGITDAFLKFTRSYIRENYASKKQRSGM